MQAIRTFLARAVPWPTSQDGWWINIHATYVRPDGVRVIPGRAFKNLERAAGHIEWLLRQNRQTDIYVCMSAQSEARTEPNKAGRMVNKAVRATANAVLLRSIWADIDVKAGAYVSTDEAILATAQFVADVGLPKPTFIVLSGSGGFHVHWITDDPMDYPTWHRLATGLSNALKSKGVKCDYGCTIDAARLLRIPDTFNWKTNPPTQVLLAKAGDVFSTSRLEAALTPFFGPPVHIGRPGLQSSTLPFRGAASPVFANVRPRGTLSGGIEEPPPVDHKLAEVRAACPWLEDTFQTGGQSAHEPLWREALKVAFYTTEGRDAAHDLSDGHAKYSQTDTDAKYDRVVQDQKTGRYGWPQCDTISRAGATQCAACPHFTQHKSPLNFVVRAMPPVTVAGNSPAAQPVVTALATSNSDLPKGYLRDTSTGWVYKITPNPVDPTAAPESNPVAPFPILRIAPQQPTELSSEPHTLTFRTNLNATSNPDIILRYDDLSDDISLGTALLKQGMGMMKTTLLRGLMMSFIQKLHAERQVVPKTESFGWSVENGQENAFVYGRTRWNCSGDTPTTVSDKELNRDYFPTGSMQVWKDASKLITDRQRPDLDMILAVSFGAPLVCLIGHSGLVVSAYSAGSGVGKTTAMKIAQSVWSNPNATMGGLTDTRNFIDKRLGNLRHLPYFYDELRVQEHTAAFADLIFAVGQGKSKGRLNRAAQSQPVQDFNTILMAASNNSLVDYIVEHTKTTTAGIYRLFEYQSLRPANEAGIVEEKQAQGLLGSLQHNFGWAGLDYAKFLGRNAPKIKTLALDTYGEFYKSLNAGQDERFWIGTMATAYCGAFLSNHIGTTNINVDRLKEFMLTEFRRMRQERKTSKVDVGNFTAVLDYVGAYVNDRRQQTIITDQVWTMPSRPPASFHVLIRNNPDRSIGRLCVHVAEANQIMRFSYNDFATWLRDKQKMPPATLIRKVLEVLPVKIVQSSIGVNTIYKTATEKLIELDLSQTPNFFDI